MASQPDMQEIALKLWGEAWWKFHNPLYSFAYMVNPEYHAAKPWTMQWSDPEDEDESLFSPPGVQNDVETLMQEWLPGEDNLDKRGKLKAALNRYKTQTGVFALTDHLGEKREIWSDVYLKETAPCLLACLLACMASNPDVCV